MHRFATGVVLAVLVASGARVPVRAAGETAGSAPGAAGRVILDEGSSWRMFAAWNTPMVRKGQELKEDGGNGGTQFAARTAPPPDGWVRPDFVDEAWSRVRWGRSHGKAYEYGWGGDAPSPTLSLLCLRGKFAVEDPAQVKGLSLSLVYRGGAVVYVNGREVARAHLPKEGKIEPGTLAEEYPPECFEHAEVIRGTKSILEAFGQPEKYREQIEKRVRRLENVAIDAKFLRPGANVLAVEVHRAPYYGNGLSGDHMNNPSVWSPCAMVDLSLRAEGGVTPNTSRPAGIQVWAANVMHRPSPLEYGDPLEKAEPVSIVACRNGAFDGRVMVTSDKAISGIKAQASELKYVAPPPSAASGHPGAGVPQPIPAANVRLFYTIRDDAQAMRYGVPAGGFWDSLSDDPPAKADVVPPGGAAQSILLKVRVPADAAPGDYAGKLTVSADGLAPTDVPVNLRVVAWTLPDPKDFGTHNGIIQ